MKSKQAKPAAASQPPAELLSLLLCRNPEPIASARVFAERGALIAWQKETGPGQHGIGCEGASVIGDPDMFLSLSKP